MSQQPIGIDGVIYLCKMDDLIRDADDRRADELMTLLGGILHKLGFQLVSGQDPHFDDLYARIDPGHASRKS
jgi:hypothetical protein